MTVAVPFTRGLFVSLSGGSRAPRHTGSAEQSLTDARHTLQAGRAVEQRRPRARLLTLCLLRMKREDFITSCRPRLHPSSLPPSKFSPPQSLPASPSSLSASPLPFNTLASSMLQGLSQPREGKETAKENLLPIACLCSAVQCTERGRGGVGAQRDEKGDEGTER